MLRVQVDSYLKNTGKAGLASAWAMARRMLKKYRRKVDEATRYSGAYLHTCLDLSIRPTTDQCRRYCHTLQTVDENNFTSECAFVFLCKMFVSIILPLTRGDRFRHYYSLSSWFHQRLILPTCLQS